MCEQNCYKKRGGGVIYHHFTDFSAVPSYAWACWTVSSGAHANLCMLCTACFQCFNTGSTNTINICLILSTIYIFYSCECLHVGRGISALLLLLRLPCIKPSNTSNTQQKIIHVCTKLLQKKRGRGVIHTSEKISRLSRCHNWQIKLVHYFVCLPLRLNGKEKHPTATVRRMKTLNISII